MKIFLFYTLLSLILCNIINIVIASCDDDPSYIKLTAKDFESGTFIIDSPGKFCLTEDIDANPNSLAFLQQQDPTITAYDSSWPLPNQFTRAGGKYDLMAYQIGFFAAIAIMADSVEIDLNGHLLQQSIEHSVQMRFYAHIELADQPFLGTQGPHSFGPVLVPATNVIIRNGRLGLSSHHGIHGNNNINVTLEDLEIFDYEVAAVALNNVKGLQARNIKGTARTGLPLSGLYSGARFVHGHIECMNSLNAPFDLRVQGVTKSLATIRSELMQVIENTYQDLVIDKLPRIDKSKHPLEYSMFHNPTGFIDGPAYGFLINKRGVATVGFPFQPIPEIDMSEDIILENISIELAVGDVHEILGLGKNGNVVLDPIGAIWNLWNRDPDTGLTVVLTSDDPTQAEYRGTPLTNAQAIISKAKNAGWWASGVNDCRADFDMSRAIIPPEAFTWIEADPGTPTAKLSSLLAQPGITWMCNGDIMFHVNKGVVGFKMDGGIRMNLKNCNVKKVLNVGKMGSDLCPYDRNTFSNPKATLPGYTGSDARGFSFSGSLKVQATGLRVDDVEAMHGSAYGFDYFGNSSRIVCDDCTVGTVKGADNQEARNEIYKPPNHPPKAHCQHIAAGTSRISVESTSCESVSTRKGPVADTVLVDFNGDVSVNSRCPR